MRTLYFILGYFIYSAYGQFNLLGLGGDLRVIQTPLVNISNPLPVPNLDNLEKLFLQDWLDFGKKFNKVYDTVEEPIRKANFLRNIDTITKLAQATGESVVNFTLAINEFADMLFEEFNLKYNGFNRNGELELVQNEGVAYNNVYNYNLLPQNVDWRSKGIITSVKHQHECGGCWAFSVTAALESHIAKKIRYMEDLSVQNLLDCAKEDYHNRGCSGGVTETGFMFVEHNGINSDKTYPYEAINTTCRSKHENNVAGCQGYVRIPEGDEKSLEEAVANVGPISAAIHVSGNLFQFYKDKVFQDSTCSNAKKKLNHAVLIVGYGKESDGRKYWLVKNSYGNGWGLDGYVKIAKDEGNMCGIATYAMYPKV